MEGPAPRTANGKPDLTGDWVRADRDPRPAELVGITAPTQPGGSNAGAVDPNTAMIELVPREAQHRSRLLRNMYVLIRQG